MAAGLGFKTFNTGDVLSAADVNGYLMQGILVFASATARDAAITSPEEGQFAFLKDTNVTTYYTGSAWANVDTTGMTNPMTTTGDVIYSSSGSTPARLGIGTAGQVLQVNSGATAPEWATPAASASGLTFITGSTFSSAASVSLPTGTFSATYLAYKVIFVAQSGTGGAVMSARFRTSGTDNSGASYYGALYGIQANGTEVSVRSGGATSLGLGVIEATNNAPFFTFDISNPFASVRTDFAGSSVFTVSGGAGAFGAMSGFFNSTTSFDSMSFILASGSMSGYYKVYGYQNS